jgi:hypothetical protein
MKFKTRLEQIVDLKLNCVKLNRQKQRHNLFKIGDQRDVRC